VSLLTDIWFVRTFALPFLDIAILAIIVYRGYLILVQTRAMQLVRGGLLLVIFFLAAYILQLKTILWILNFLAPGLVIGIVIIFQPELRKIFTRIGQGKWFRFSEAGRSLELDSVMNAVTMLAEIRRGAIIVIGRSVGLKNIIDTGTVIDAELSSSLIVTIFGYDTPLHDGAIVIDKTRIVAAGCFLPLSEQSDFLRSFGTRHQAALGLAEESDAVIIVVSEENGAKSLAYDSKFFYDLTEKDMLAMLQDLFLVREKATEKDEVLELEE
jgi:diadenylate cyclase